MSTHCVFNRREYIGDYVVLHDGNIEDMESRMEVARYLIENGLRDNADVTIMFWDEDEQRYGAYALEDIFASI